MNIVLVGAGNLATNLGRAISRSGNQIVQIYSRTEASAKALADMLGCTYTTSLDELVKRAGATIEDAENQTIFICHGDCLEDAQYVANKAKEELKVKDVIIGYTGPVIGSHSGPGTMAIFTLGKNRD